ncbi:hypothetical protein KVT40_000689 [Elsinoe batatas]|uniref:Uncharacterized protein n=1 Tax=Elsinoe batatas TaxID=2601811 RepID=A0A8K0L873_9PEZI|nr:hypothetical protein KVT40_000689 [Elsinoe batatas]
MCVIRTTYTVYENGLRIPQQARHPCQEVTCGRRCRGLRYTATEEHVQTQRPSTMPSSSTSGSRRGSRSEAGRSSTGSTSSRRSSWLDRFREPSHVVVTHRHRRTPSNVVHQVERPTSSQGSHAESSTTSEAAPTYRTVNMRPSGATPPTSPRRPEPPRSDATAPTIISSPSRLHQAATTSSTSSRRYAHLEPRSAGSGRTRTNLNAEDQSPPRRSGGSSRTITHDPDPRSRDSTSSRHSTTSRTSTRPLPPSHSSHPRTSTSSPSPFSTHRSSPQPPRTPPPSSNIIHDSQPTMRTATRHSLPPNTVVAPATSTSRHSRIVSTPGLSSLEPSRRPQRDSGYLSSPQYTPSGSDASHPASTYYTIAPAANVPTSHSRHTSHTSTSSAPFGDWGTFNTPDLPLRRLDTEFRRGSDSGFGSERRPSDSPVVPISGSATLGQEGTRHRQPYAETVVDSEAGGSGSRSHHSHSHDHNHNRDRPTVETSDRSPGRGTAAATHGSSTRPPRAASISRSRRDEPWLDDRRAPRGGQRDVVEGERDEWEDRRLSRGEEARAYMERTGRNGVSDAMRGAWDDAFRGIGRGSRRSGGR